MENSDDLESSCSKRFGAGLPYAPINWPNPGDIWTWKLGNRISSKGFYKDRYIYPPPRLQKISGRKLFFDSKKSIATYLQNEFPEADIAAFFNSFTWKVPAYVSYSAAKDSLCHLAAMEEKQTTQVPPRPRKVRPQTNSERNGVTSSFKRRSLRIMTATRRAKYPSQKFSISDSKDVSIIDLTESTTDDSNSANDNYTASSHSSEELQSEMVSDDMLISSEDKLPSEYLPDSSDLASVSHQSTAPRKEMVEAREKLSLLLATDNPVLLSSIKLAEILSLTSLLKTDSTLDANQHDILKLIDEIPLACKELQENENLSVEADRFEEDLETDIAWESTLENEYKDLVGYESLLRTEVESNTQKIKELEEEVAALTKGVEMKKKELDKLISKKQMVNECLARVSQEIETGKDQKAEWELKKQRAEEQKARILSKFAFLRGFTL